MAIRTGISFLIGTVRNDGQSIFKSEHVASMVPDIRTWFPGVTRWKGTCVYWAVWPANCTPDRRKWFGMWLPLGESGCVR